MQSFPLIDLRNVSYSVNGKCILDGANWCLQRGQHWAVLGRNGAGKTTLLEVACGHKWPNAGGEVLRNGEPLIDLTEMRRRIGWVASTLVANIPLNEPVRDTVVSGKYATTGLFRLLYERPTKNDYDRAEELLDRIGMAALGRRPFGVLSQGEKQKTLLARAQMVSPILMILDEPCAGLDPASREAFLTTVQGLAEVEDAPSMVLVTHHVDEILPVFQSTLVVDNAKIARSGRTREVLDLDLVQTLYDGAVTRLVWEKGRCWPIC
jgi:iron complex transport system ATP-binding protein